MTYLLKWAADWFLYWTWLYWLERRYAKEPCCDDQEADGRCPDCRMERVA